LKAPSVIPASHSSISAYETCPKQFYELRIAKTVKQEQTKEIVWGNDTHKAAENAVKYNRPLPANMQQYQWALDLVRGMQKTMVVHAELDVAITEAREPTGFWDQDAWVRGKIDVLAHDEAFTRAFNGDYKTGKTRPNSKQLVLSTLMCFDNYKTLERVKTGFLWLPEPDPTKRITQQLFIKLDDDRIETTDIKGHKVVQTFEELWEPFVNVIEQMKWSLANNVWPANPSGLCKAWCPVLSCPHNGKR
jgi:hypothetical protein